MGTKPSISNIFFEVPMKINKISANFSVNCKKY